MEFVAFIPSTTKVDRVHNLETLLVVMNFDIANGGIVTGEVAAAWCCCWAVFPTTKCYMVIPLENATARSGNAKIPDEPLGNIHASNDFSSSSSSTTAEEEWLHSEGTAVTSLQYAIEKNIHCCQRQSASPRWATSASLRIGHSSCNNTAVCFFCDNYLFNWLILAANLFNSTHTLTSLNSMAKYEFPSLVTARALTLFVDFCGIRTHFQVSCTAGLAMYTAAREVDALILTLYPPWNYWGRGVYRRLGVCWDCTIPVLRCPCHKWPIPTAMNWAPKFPRVDTPTYTRPPLAF